MAVVLTRRGITIMSSDDAEEVPTPLILQVWDIRPMMCIPSSGAGEGHQAADTTTTKRYPMLLSDGDHILRALLTTQMHGIVREEGGGLQKGSIVQLHEFTCNLIDGRRIIIVINLEVLVEECELIGEPKNYDNSSVALQNRAALPASLSGADQQGVPPMHPNMGPTAKNEAPALLVPVAALNPYSRWTIKARVTSKGELRCYTNSKGVGKFFSFDLIDSEGGEIRVTCFDLLADKFYYQIEFGKVYLISKGSLRPAQKNFNHLNNEYEIVLQPTSTIQPCREEDNSFPKQQFNFRTISEVENVDFNSIVDLIGIVSSVSPVDLITRKNGTETHRRTLQLKDMSGRSVEMTLWGNLCTGEGQKLQVMCDSGMHPVLAVKAGRVSDYSGKSVGTIFTSQLFINPDFPEAHRLKEWFSKEGMGIAAPSISRDSPIRRADARKTISQIKDEGLGRSGMPDWITVKAIVCFVKSDTFCYAACPLMVDGRQCEKKVIDNGNGTWQCERCNQSLQECDYRYLLQFLIQDHTGMQWVTAFEESGEEIMGVSAKNLYHLKFKEQDGVKFADILKKVAFNQYIFKLKVKEESFNNEQRVKSIVVKAEKLNPSSESRYLLGLIEKLSGESSNRMQQMCGTSNPSLGVPNTHHRPSLFPLKCGRLEATLHRRFDTGYSNNTMEFNSGAQPNNYMFGGVADTSRMGSMSQTGFCANECDGAMNQNSPRDNSRQGQFLVGDFGNRTSNAEMNGVNSSNVCFKCHLPGHWARDCPRSNGVCFKCRLPGHWARDCPGSNGVRF